MMTTVCSFFFSRRGIKNLYEGYNMIQKRWLVTVACYGLLAVFALQAGDNLLQNPGFETVNADARLEHNKADKVSGWTVLYFPLEKGMAAVVTEAKSGQYALALGCEAGNKINRTLSWTSESVAVSPGEVFDFSIFIKTRDLIPGKREVFHKPGAMVIYYDESGKRIKHSDLFRVGQEVKDWQKFSRSISVPKMPRVKSMRVTLVFSYCNGLVFFDDVELRKVQK